MNEYIITLPVILFVYSFLENYKLNDFKDSIKNAINQTLPYLIGFLLYSIYFLFSSYRFFQASSFNFAILFFERIFWLTPQIFFHYIKLIFFPKVLSIDQTSFVLFGKSLFDPYSVFCFFFMVCWLLIPLILFLRNKKTYWLLITCWLFFISIIPFSQFLSPTYCLAAERYLYTPIFFIVFGVSLAFNQFFSDSKTIPKNSIIYFLSIIVLLLSVRSHIRTNDWKDNLALIKSAIKTSYNDLYKGSRIRTLSKEIQESNPDEAKKYFKKAQDYFYKELKRLKKEKNINEPLILKSYGLDNESLLIKTVHLISFNAFIDPKDNYKKYLKLFTQYEKYSDRFDPKTLEIYANLLIKNNEMNKAKEVFLYAYSRFPTSPFILLSLIRFEREIDKNLINSKQYLTEGLKLYPYSKEILFETLRQSQLENNLAEYTRYSYLYGLRTHSKFTYQEALTGFLTLGDLNGAKKTIDKLLALDENDPKTLYLSSSYYIKKNNYTQALELLNKAYSVVKSKNAEQQLAFDITNTIANLYLSLGNTKESLYFANEALNYTKNNPENLNRIKRLMNTIGKSE
jgi:Tfp pilus assembly protein PilF